LYGQGDRNMNFWWQMKAVPVTLLGGTVRGDGGRSKLASAPRNPDSPLLEGHLHPTGSAEQGWARRR
jgi:hypothetical protein